MFRRLLLRTAGRLVARPIRRRLNAFVATTHHPETAQSDLLQRIIAKQRDTGFGRDHGFSTIRTVEDFRRQIPVAPYEYVAPYVQRVQKGETSALLSDPQVLMFALTSGTTASRKMIPITQDYLDDYRRGWNIWGLTAMRDHPVISLKPMAQMVGDPEEFRCEAGIPCGNLSGYTAQVQKKIVRGLYTVPAYTGKIKDPVSRYYVALLCSLRRKVGMLMAANPSTLVALARVLDLHKENLLRDLAQGTLSNNLDIAPELRAALALRLKADPAQAKKLEAIAQREPVFLPKHVWKPEELMIGCWTGGSVGPYLRQLPDYYGNTLLRDIGLLASEGRMTIPLEDNSPAGVLDISSHYFEFIPEGEIESKQPICLRAHELEEGKPYYILLTTKSGLYRYHIVDLVRMTGKFNGTPLIEFLGKGNRFANLTGEKLSEHHVTQAMIHVMKTIPQPITAYALAPVWDEKQPYYGIFLEEQDMKDPVLLASFLKGLEAELRRQNVEYDAKRDSGRLGPVQALKISTGAWSRWDKQNLAKRGGSPEQYKHPCLIGDLEFVKEIEKF
ncbi:GH3 auxin-responsive promoter family protein [Telmatocola sphagniphila]|uniref:GH3 auxin-responsive promoter family protein n=1 Tax=Telmatocola sphagniphila TaxID=1123043 RepID=A0A8E6EUB9_9BACT|nr:GH3 auxin-responsive promoter family protein [Telmatocola sphagniphila]QVL31180.1 GH3 auxin-responsive promoter family protein [Telmatocola sphagniphila]